jgi:ABC-type phosphate transport system substrate-binding protein
MNKSNHRARKLTAVFAILMIASMSSLLVSKSYATITPGTLKLDGSSTVYPIAADAAANFSNWLADPAHGWNISGETVNLPFPPPGSGTGLNELVAGTIDVADASKFPSAGNAAGLPTMKLFPVAVDSISIIVHSAGGNTPGNLITQLTDQNVSDIFVGAITDWHAFNPAIPINTTINVAVRVSTSGTADGFSNFFLKPFHRTTANITASALVETDNQDIINLMTNPVNTWFIAYVGLGFTDVAPPPNVQTVGVSFKGGPYVAPLKANVKNGTYAPYRYLFMDAPGTLNQTDAVQRAWIAYVRSPIWSAWPNPNPTGNVSATTWVDKEGYIRLPWADLTNSTNVPSVILGGGSDACPAGQQNYPDQLVNYDDVVFFAKAYISALNGGVVNPLCDFNADGKLTLTDVFGFAQSYIAANAS